MPSAEGKNRFGWLVALLQVSACVKSTAVEARAIAEPVQEANPAVPVPAPAPPVSGDLDAPAASTAELQCPEGMARLRRLQGPYCIDRWESSLMRVSSDGKQSFWPSNRPVDGIEREVVALSVSGRKPQGYISGAQAALACARAGKRLCEIDEWVRACRGSRFFRYPYGDKRSPDLCNDRFKKLDHHPVVTLFGRSAAAGTDPKLMWHPSFMNDPRLFELAHTVSPAGAFPRCTNDFQVFDMVGNLHEWVADPDGTFMGGFFMDTFQNGEGCEYRTIAHEFEYHDYSTGFRCCADPTPARAAAN